MDRRQHTTVPNLPSKGSTFARVGGLVVELPDDSKEEENEAFVYPAPHVAMGSPGFANQSDAVAAALLPANVAVYASVAFKSNLDLEIQLFRSFQRGPEGKPEVPGPRPVIREIPAEFAAKREVQLLTTLTYSPRRSAERLEYGKVKDYAKNSTPFVLDCVDSTSGRAIRMLFYKQREEGGLMWYRRNRSLQMNISMQ